MTGKASPVAGALTASMYLVLRYADDLPAALVANALVGGDSASRAIAVGCILGSAAAAAVVDYGVGVASRTDQCPGHL